MPKGTGGGFQGVAWGPEGDLYIALANPVESDRWGYWTFFNGTKTPYRGQGAILRCKPDGSALRVVAGGLDRPPRWRSIATGICSLVIAASSSTFRRTGSLAKARGHVAGVSGANESAGLVLLRRRTARRRPGRHPTLSHGTRRRRLQDKRANGLRNQGCRALAVGAEGRLFTISANGALAMLARAMRRRAAL